MAARQVNLTVQSVLKKEELILRQLDSIDCEERERQQVFVPISISRVCNKQFTLYHNLLLQVHQELGHSSIGRFERGLTLVPVGRAHLTVLVAELKSLDHTNGLLDVAAHTVVVDVDVTDLLVGIDQEQTAERLSVVHSRLIFVEHSVRLHGVSGHVRQQRNVDQTAQTTLRASCLQPAQMRVRGVTGDSEHNRIDGVELIRGIAVGEELRGADEGPVHGVEQQDNPLALVGVKGHIGEGVVSLSAVEAKVGSSLTNRNRHYKWKSHKAEKE